MKNLTSYQIRVFKEIQMSLESALRMIERDINEHPSELMARLPAIRNQCMQAGLSASELYGAISQQRNVI